MRASGWMRVAGVVLCVGAAWAVFGDRHGLQGVYHPLTTDYADDLTFRHVDAEPGIDEEFVKAFFMNPSFFSVRWRGWIRIETEGRHAFRVTSSDPGYLTIDGEEVLTIRDAEREGVELTRTGRLPLSPGLHAIEIGVAHSGHSIRFEPEWKPPGQPSGPIPTSLLFPERPGPIRRLVRSALGGFNSVGRQLVGTLFLLAAALLTWLEARHRGTGRLGHLASWAADPRRRRALEWGGIAGLFLIVTAWAYSRAGSPFGWDDVRYLDIAAFNKKVGWVANRYAYIYLFKPFFWLAGGDPFVAARIFWSVQLGVIVAAMAAATRFLAPRRRLATLGVGLFLLWSQPLFFVRIGAVVPDTMVGAQLLVAVVILLHRQSRDTPPRWEWHIFAIGLLTVWAFKSKELGVILVWLCAAFPFERGRLHLRGIPRKIGGWLAGAATGLLLLAVCDGLMLGDPLFGLRPSHQRAVADINMAEHPQQAREAIGWMQVVWEGKSPVTDDDRGFKYLALLVALAALLSSVRRSAIEVRLLHLLPILYLAMVIAIHIRATYVLLARYLYPVIPLSCLLAAVGVYHLGLDRLRWKDVARPRFFVPAALLAFLTFGIVLPYKVLLIQPEDFLPAKALHGLDWVSLDAFVHLTAGPLLVLGLVLALAFFSRDLPTRLLLVSTLLLLALGTSFYRNAWALSKRHAEQRAAIHLYPWTTFGNEISENPALKIVVSPALRGAGRFFGPAVTIERIGRLALDQPYAWIRLRNVLTPEHHYAFLPPEHYRYWRNRWPALEETASIGPNGRLVMVRPAEARRPDPLAGRVPGKTGKAGKAGSAR